MKIDYLKLVHCPVNIYIITLAYFVVSRPHVSLVCEFEARRARIRQVANSYKPRKRSFFWASLNKPHSPTHVCRDPYQASVAMGFDPENQSISSVGQVSLLSLHIVFRLSFFFPILLSV